MPASSTSRRIAVPSLLLAAACGFTHYGCGRPPAAQTSPPNLAAAGQNGGVRFEDVAEEKGLVFKMPLQPRPMRNVEAFGTGCAFLDYDQDGWQDVLLVADARAGLFRNLKGERFEDVSQDTGLSEVTGDLNGCSVADYDNDGDLDLFLTGIRKLALLRFDGGRYTDVTASAGLDPKNRNHWGSSAGWMDLDGDGNLDLVVLNYVIFGPKEPQYCELTPGVKSGCPPSRYKPEFAELWQNKGGRFVDVTQSSGMRETSGKGLVLAYCDINGDGRHEFYIGNDGTPAELMANLGGMKFRNVGQQAGTAYGEIPGHSLAAMGADWADYDRDGRMDLAVSGFSDESYALFRSAAPGLFEITAPECGISGPTFKTLGFGTKWLDFDNDGWPDLSFVNGHVYDRAEEIDPLSPYKQPMMLFHNRAGGDGRVFQDLVPGTGGDIARPIVGRGSATGDFDNDGRTDLLVVDYEGNPLLLENKTETKNHWVGLDFRADGKNRFAYGATVTLESGKEKWVGQVSPCSSYLSYSDPRVHFGLGSAATIDRLTVRWPSGKKQTLEGIPVDRILTLHESRGLVDRP